MAIINGTYYYGHASKNQRRPCIEEGCANIAKPNFERCLLHRSKKVKTFAEMILEKIDKEKKS